MKFRYIIKSSLFKVLLPNPPPKELMKKLQINAFKNQYHYLSQKGVFVQDGIWTQYPNR